MTPQKHAPAAMERTLQATESNFRQPYRFDTLSVEQSKLVCVEGPYQGQDFPLDKPFLSVGREAWCDIALERDRRISRHHCDISITKQGIKIHDRGSRNGIELNHVRVTEAWLQPKQSLRVGKSVFELVVLSEAKQTLRVPFYDQSNTLVGKSPQMQRLFSMLPGLGRSDVPVLLLGETGTGKTSVAQALHKQSSRANGPFVVVNCGALNPMLIESSLFGHEKGAFTDAKHRHQGFFEQAHGGTLFLDEIGELPLGLQPKLLDVLERQKIRRLGSHVEQDVDFRLITATHQSFDQAIAQKTFREDLYFRIAIVELRVPALRERPEDIPLLLDYLCQNLEQQGTPIPDFSEEAQKVLQQYLWPGNVRQLRNVLQRNILQHSLMQASSRTIEVDDLLLPESDLLSFGLDEDSAPAFQSGENNECFDERGYPLASMRDLLAREEERILRQTLENLDWDYATTIKSLGFSRAVFFNRLQKYSIRRP